MSSESNNMYKYRSTNFDQNTKVLEDPIVKRYLEDLHKIYVLVPADKAANNVIIICKKYYYSVLIKELGLDGNNDANPTYTLVNKSLEDIIKSHVKYMTKKCINISEKQENLHKIYWTPKLHKDPIKSRFIAGSRVCTT